MRWATRQGVHIDRAACAWLIRRFIDADAHFIFVSDVADVPADATAFDMPGVDLSHHGDDCTFETLLRRNDLTDPVLWRVAALVHEADIDDGHYDAPEAPRVRPRSAGPVHGRDGRPRPGARRAAVRRHVRVLPP